MDPRISIAMGLASNCLEHCSFCVQMNCTLCLYVLSLCFCQEFKLPVVILPNMSREYKKFDAQRLQLRFDLLVYPTLPLKLASRQHYLIPEHAAIASSVCTLSLEHIISSHMLLTTKYVCTLALQYVTELDVCV